MRGAGWFPAAGPVRLVSANRRRSAGRRTFVEGSHDHWKLGVIGCMDGSITRRSQAIRAAGLDPCRNGGTITSRTGVCGRETPLQGMLAFIGHQKPVTLLDSIQGFQSSPLESPATGRPSGAAAPAASAGHRPGVSSSGEAGREGAVRRTPARVPGAGPTPSGVLQPRLG